MSDPDRSVSRARLWTRRTIQALLLLVGTGALALGTAAVMFYLEATKDLPSIEEVVDYVPPVATQVYAHDGTLIAEFFEEKRYVIPISSIPIVVREAFLAAEDADFYEHGGVDLRGILRAFASNLIAGHVVQGGSTITQQVVKSLLLTPERSYERKVKEVVLALRIESELSKDEILELYLNQIYLGSGAYGVAAAAEEYFGKRVDDLSLAEASLLAGLPQAPSRYSPRNHPERARRRQLYVLQQMEIEGFITAEQRTEAAADEIEVASERIPSYRAAPWYVEHVRRELVRRFGDKALYRMGLRVHTSLDPGLQEAAARALETGLREVDRRQGYRGPLAEVPEAEWAAEKDRLAEALPDEISVGDALEGLVVEKRKQGYRVDVGRRDAFLPADAVSWAGKKAPRPGDRILLLVEELPGDDGPLRVSLHQKPAVEGAVLAMDPHTGLVRAMVGGYSFARSHFNRAVQARRQPGSAFKPFIYAAAFDRGFTPASVVIDAPVVFDTSQFTWKPENYSTKWYGPTRLREALTHSRNVISVKLASDMGLPYLVDYLRRFGFSGPLPQNLSISLGSAEVSLLELVRAYGVFPSGGRLYEPIFVTSLTDRNGNVIEATSPEWDDAIPPETAYLVTSVLQDVIRRGTGRGARSLGRPIAGKTGTTNDQRDAWFMGFSPNLVAGAWVGFDEKETLGRRETGGRAALPVWREFMREALEDEPVSDFSVPPGITFVNIDKATGLRAAPTSNEILLEAFRAGTEPTRFSPDKEGPKEKDFFEGDF